MPTDAPWNEAPPARPVVFLIATAITLLFGFVHFYEEFAPKSPEKRAFDIALNTMRMPMSKGFPAYSGYMESLSLSLSALTITIGIVNLLVLKETAPHLRQRASLIYCVTFALLGVLYRSHDVLLHGNALGVIAIWFLTDAVRSTKRTSRQ